MEISAQEAAQPPVSTTSLLQRMQKFQEGANALLGLVHVDLMPGAFNNSNPRVGDQRTHANLIGERRDRTLGRRQDKGWRFDLWQEWRGISAIERAGKSLEPVRRRLRPFIA